MQESSPLGAIRALILGRRNSARINRDNEGILPLRYLTIFAVAFVAILTACEPAKPSGNEYVGRWNVSKQFCHCVLNITKNGNSFLVESSVSSSQASCDLCRTSGILTLSPEGNLVNNGFVVMSFDKTKNQIVMQDGSGMNYISKEP
jgi:hypothetical protein